MFLAIIMKLESPEHDIQVILDNKQNSLIFFEVDTLNPIDLRMYK